MAMYNGQLIDPSSPTQCFLTARNAAWKGQYGIVKETQGWVGRSVRDGRKHPPALQCDQRGRSDERVTPEPSPQGL